MTHAEALEAIYAEYPRKVGRRKALQSIERAIKRLTSKEEGPMHEMEAVVGLVAACRAFAASPAGQRGHYTPHPTTWFNASRYLDSQKEWFHEESSPQLAQAQRNSDVIARVFGGKNRGGSPTHVATVSRRVDGSQGNLLEGTADSVSDNGNRVGIRQLESKRRVFSETKGHNAAD